MLKTLTNGQVTAGARALDRILASTPDLPGGAVQVPLARSLRVLVPLAGDVEAARGAIIREHAEVGDDGEPVAVPVADAPDGTLSYTLRDPAAARAALDELLAAEVEVALYPPDLDRLPTLDAGDLMALLDLFDGPGTGPPAAAADPHTP